MNSEALLCIHINKEKYIIVLSENHVGNFLHSKSNTMSGKKAKESYLSKLHLKQYFSILNKSTN